MERGNKGIKRHTNVVGVFLSPNAIILLVGSVLFEQHDEWKVTKSCEQWKKVWNSVP